jgi:hypothetical protein
MPPILGCSIEANLEPTMKFCYECVGLDATKTLIANNPRLLGSSFRKRLKPRHAECQEAGIPIDEGAVERIAAHAEKKWSSSMAFQNAKPLKERPPNRQQQLSPSPCQFSCLVGAVRDNWTISWVASVKFSIREYWTRARTHHTRDRESKRVCD